MKGLLKLRFTHYILVTIFVLLGTGVASLFFSGGKVKRNPTFMLSGDDWAEQQIAKMSLETKIAQLFIIGATDLNDSVKRLAYQKMYASSKVGGFVIYNCNSQSLKTFSAALKRDPIAPFIAIDAEFGASQRISDLNNFPTQLTMGATNNSNLTAEIGKQIAEEAKTLGVNMILGPVSEMLQSKGDQAVNFRSFGGNEFRVTPHLLATVKAYDDAGMITVLKHFPGYTATEKHPHESVQVIDASVNEVNDQTKTFVSGFNAKAAGVMVGHAKYAQLDPDNLSSFSPKIVTELLRKGNAFSGLIFSDALNVPVITINYSSSDAALRAYYAGCDILLSPQNLEEAKAAILMAVNRKEIILKELESRVKRILKAKYFTRSSSIPVSLAPQKKVSFTKQQVFEEAITVLKNVENILPLGRLDKKIAYVTIGAGGKAAQEMTLNFARPDFFFAKDGKEAIDKLSGKIMDYDLVLTSIFATTPYPSATYGMPDDWQKWCAFVPKEKAILTLFANPFCLSELKSANLPNGVVCGYENDDFAQQTAIQMIFGAQATIGKLPMKVSEEFSEGAGIQLQANGRLKITTPEELGFNSKNFETIDYIAERGISSKAFPGCQVVVAVKGKIIYQKSFGKHTYDGEIPVKNNDLYDIASITKIAASTMAMMHLQTNGKFSLDSKLKDFLPHMAQKGSMGDINLRAMMAHQAGFYAWVPFFRKTLSEGVPSKKFYESEQSKDFPFQVASKLYLKKEYFDSIYDQIYASDFRPGKGYEYSDLGYYFAKPVIEALGGKDMDEYIYDNIYKPMGLGHMRYTPYKYFGLDQLIPTENDKEFRKQLVHGFVHDPGAAMLGGVGGHAGVFSNANNLCALMQMTMNNGSYSGVSYLKKEVVEEYTSCQFCPRSRRGAGFDRQTPTGLNGPMGTLASNKTYGHTGFTGTCTWVDPVNEVVFVFLSNRVYPDANNWKIKNMNIRSEIHDAIYRAIKP